MRILAVLTVAAVFAWAGGQGGRTVGGVPVFAVLGVVAFLINAAAFLPAWAARTERFYDVTGSATYLVVLALALVVGSRSPRGWLLALACATWAARLGTHLYARIRREGRDGRFDAIKQDPARFLLAWLMQALWVYLTAGAALAAMTAPRAVPLDGWAVGGALLWACGFAVEALADAQKAHFRREHPGRFVDRGLWAWSRHPNYCGEVVLWLGVALIAVPELEGPARITLVSPLFVFLLLTRVSGIPLLEARADARWGGKPDYEAYRARTPVLWLRPPS